MTKLLFAGPLLVAVATLGACATNGPGPVDQRNSALTQGNVQLSLRVGETSKADVLDKFGSPNITTRDASGSEVWSYQRHARAFSDHAGSYPHELK